MDRDELAQKIAASMAGWMQRLACHGILSLAGEDAAKLEFVQTIKAIGAYTPRTSQRPTNWPEEYQGRVDVALLGRTTENSGWYGAVELKWSCENRNQVIFRRDLVQDAIRVAFSRTSNLNASFVILAGDSAGLSALSENPHSRGGAREEERLAFNRLFKRSIADREGSLTHEELSTYYPGWNVRVPREAVADWNRRLATTLLGKSTAMIGPDECAAVYVWQCRR